MNTQLPCGKYGSCRSICKSKSWEEKIKCLGKIHRKQEKKDNITPIIEDKMQKEPTRKKAALKKKETAKVKIKIGYRKEDEVIITEEYEIEDVYKKTYNTQQEKREQIAQHKLALIEIENGKLRKESWKYFVANEALIHKLTQDTIRRLDKEQNISLLSWQIEKTIDEADITQIIAEKMPKKLKQGKEIYQVKRLAENAVKKAVRDMAKTSKNALDIVTLATLEAEDKDIVTVGDIYTKSLQYEYEVDDTTEKVKAFLELFGTEIRTIITLKMMGYTQTEIAKKMGKGLDEISAVMNTVQLVARVVFKDAVEYMERRYTRIIAP